MNAKGSRRFSRARIILPLGLAGVLLILMLISVFTPIVVSHGGVSSLPAWYCGLWDGSIRYGALSSVPVLPANAIRGGRRWLFHHSISLFAPTITIDSENMRGFPRIGTLTDSSLPLKAPGPVSVTRACYTRLTIFPRALLLLCALLCFYPAVTFVRGPLRRYRRTKKGLCLQCGYNLTGNVSGTCPECGTPARQGTGHSD